VSVSRFRKKCDRLAGASLNRPDAFEQVLAARAGRTAGNIEERGATVAAGAKEIGAKARFPMAAKEREASLGI